MSFLRESRIDLRVAIEHIIQPTLIKFEQPIRLERGVDGNGKGGTIPGNREIMLLPENVGLQC